MQWQKTAYWVSHEGQKKGKKKFNMPRVMAAKFNMPRAMAARPNGAPHVAKAC